MLKVSVILVLIIASGGGACRRSDKGCCRHRSYCSDRLERSRLGNANTRASWWIANSARACRSITWNWSWWLSCWEIHHCWSTRVEASNSFQCRGDASSSPLFNHAIDHSSSQDGRIDSCCWRCLNDRSNSGSGWSDSYGGHGCTLQFISLCKRVRETSNLRWAWSDRLDEERRAIFTSNSCTWSCTASNSLYRISNHSEDVIEDLQHKDSYRGYV